MIVNKNSNQSQIHNC